VERHVYQLIKLLSIHTCCKFIFETQKSTVLQNIYMYYIASNVTSVLSPAKAVKMVTDSRKVTVICI